MELWIRSQDRKRLYKATELLIEKDIYKDWCIETEIGHDYITKDVWYICVNQARLGKYFNEERALEVLDEIQNKMLNGVFAKKINGLGEELDLIPNPILIYNMPEK